MYLKITWPDDFPLHGFDRDMFETKLHDALRFCFYGNTVRQLTGRVDARRTRVASDALPLRRSLLRNVGVRIGLTVPKWGDSALPSLDEPVNHAAGHAMEIYATNRQPGNTPPIDDRQPPRASRIWLAAGLCAAAAIGGAARKLTRPAAPLSATVVCTSTAKTLRELASSVPDDRRPYRVSVQIEPQDTGSTPR